ANGSRWIVLAGAFVGFSFAHSLWPKTERSDEHGNHDIRIRAKYNNPGPGYGTMIQDMYYKTRIKNGST
ncbi:MAG: hypothetical protein ACI8PT_003811, partial [Gammaproteobacteria bacterium]